jgi:hypothetical protein
MGNRDYGGSTGSPIEIKYRRASAQTQQRNTEESTRTCQQSHKSYVPDDDENEAAWKQPKQHTSAVRLDRPPRRETTHLEPAYTKKMPYRRPFMGRLLVILGLGMMVMLLGWMALSWLGAWWTIQTNDWTYGRPRTFQVDHVVGHHDSAEHPSHFIAMNLNRRVVVIEIPGGDPSKMATYLGPTLVGDGQDLTPITITFEDRNGDGKPDLNIHILDQVIVFLNENGKFVSTQQQ